VLRGSRVVVLLVLALTGCGGDGLSGHSVLVDDTGRDDVSDGGGWVLVVPSHRERDLWSAVGGRPDDLPHAGFPVDAATADGVGGVLVGVSDDGDWSVTSTGPSLLCRVSPGGSALGCVEVDLPETGNVTTEFGEGGLSAQVQE
jgi:hypothetical protein